MFIELLPSSGQFLLTPLLWPFSCHVTIFTLTFFYLITTNSENILHPLYSNSSVYIMRQRGTIINNYTINHMFLHIISVRLNLSNVTTKFCTIIMCIINIQKVLQNCKYIYDYFHTKFHVYTSSSSGSLIITIKLKTKRRFHASSILL
jgi:DNA-directed RNA polymerase subunit L